MRFSRNLKIVLSLIAGTCVCLFMFFCNSMPTFVGLIVSAGAWLWLQFTISPHGVYLGPVARAYRYFVGGMGAIYIIGHDKIPPSWQLVSISIISIALFGLILLLAYADFRDL